MNVEFQVVVEEELKPRILAYWAHHFLSELEAGNKYTVLEPTIAVWILHGSLSKHPTAHSVYRVQEKTTQSNEFDLLEVHLFEYNKPMGNITNEKLKNWRKFFQVRTEKDLKEVKEMKDEVISNAGKKLETLSVKPQFRKNAYEKYKSSLKDFISTTMAEAKGEAKGRAEGLAKGEAKALYRILKLKKLHEGLNKDTFIDEWSKLKLEDLEEAADLAEDATTQKEVLDFLQSKK